MSTLSYPLGIILNSLTTSSSYVSRICDILQLLVSYMLLDSGSMLCMAISNSSFSSCRNSTHLEKDLWHFFPSEIFLASKFQHLLLLITLCCYTLISISVNFFVEGSQVHSIDSINKDIRYIWTLVLVKIVASKFSRIAFASIIHFGKGLEGYCSSDLYNFAIYQARSL